jgi:hypothetical protein
MKRRIQLLSVVSALAAGVIACSSKSATPIAPTSVDATSAADLPADGSTLKVDAATAVSPVNDEKLLTSPTVLSARAGGLQFVSGVALQYRFQVFDAAGTMVENALSGEPTHTVAAELFPNTRHTWRVRPEVQGEGGPWSAIASFISEDPSLINDTLITPGFIGNRSVSGGRFLPGQGWQSLSLVDAISYDVPVGCISFRLVFDATNFGGQEGLPYQKDLKWVSMGDAGAFGSFGAFRNHPWKMHLIQRADHPTGMEIIWRNGGTNPEGDPGDHRIKLTNTPITFSSSRDYHFQLDWDIFGFQIYVNGIQVMEEGWDHWYELTNLRVQLGCAPRAESMVGIIYRNVKLTKR